MPRFEGSFRADKKHGYGLEGEPPKRVKYDYGCLVGLHILPSPPFPRSFFFILDCARAMGIEREFARAATLTAAEHGADTERKADTRSRCHIRSSKYSTHSAEHPLVSNIRITQGLLVVSSYPLHSPHQTVLPCARALISRMCVGWQDAERVQESRKELSRAIRCLCLLASLFFEHFS